MQIASAVKKQLVKLHFARIGKSICKQFNLKKSPIIVFSETVAWDVFMGDIHLILIYRPKKRNIMVQISDYSTGKSACYYLKPWKLTTSWIIKRLEAMLINSL